MADRRYFKNRHFSATVQDIAMKFGSMTQWPTVNPIST